MLGKPKSYYRKKTKENYKKTKELSRMYREYHYSKPGESFTEFKKRMNKVKKSFN